MIAPIGTGSKGALRLGVARPLAAYLCSVPRGLTYSLNNS